MKLRAKVVLIVVGVTSVFSMLLGFSILSVTYDSAIREVKANITNFKQQIKNSEEDPVSMALLLGESREFNIKYFEADGTITSLVDSYRNKNNSQQVSQPIDLGSGEKLVIFASIEKENRARDTSLWMTLILSIIGGIGSGLICFLFMKRDIAVIKRIKEEAELVASGDLEEITGKKASAEIKQLSEALSEMTKQLQSSREQMKVFIGDASHELKTPLTVIRGYLDLLSHHEDLAPAKRKVAVERSLSESLRMQRLITDLLQLAELEEAPRIEMVAFSLGDLVAEMVADLQIQQPRRKVDLFLEPEAVFIGSKELMSQVLGNAFQNIIRYTKEADRVRITLQTFDDETYLLIEDSGPGIAKLQDGKVINSFNRFDESRSRSSGGSGLGLSIMAKIVDLHGGTMQLTKSELGGLQVALRFPQKRVS